jgi:hypothetical protein
MQRSDDDISKTGGSIIEVRKERCQGRLRHCRTSDCWCDPKVRQETPEPPRTDGVVRTNSWETRSRRIIVAQRSSGGGNE